MHAVLEFPAKVFVQWGAIAQEIVPYLMQRGVKRDEIPAVLERVRTRWEQLGPSGPCAARSETDGLAHACGQGDEGDLYASRHWRSQTARMLIESAMADYLSHAHG